MANVKIGSNYLNSYEQLHNIIKTRPTFRQEDWDYNATHGNLDAYIDVIYDSDQTTMDTLLKEYNYEYADSATRSQALFNEKYADRTNSELRTRYKIDEDGNYVFVDGTPQIEEYYASDYDYYKELIKSQNDEQEELAIKYLEQQAKDEMNGFVKFMAGALATAGEFTYGLLSVPDNIVTAITAAVDSSISAIRDNTSWSDEFVSRMGNDDYYLLGSKDLQAALTEFERKYTNIRDIDGNTQSVGGFISSIAVSVGQMLPSMIIGKGIGQGLSATGVAASTAGTVAKVTSTTIFYTSMAIDNIHDMYQYFEQNGMTYSSAAIIGNAALKSAMQWAVEFGLSKITGITSNIDQFVFGREAGKAVLSSSLTKSAIKRIGADFFEEGLEEVFQDVSDYLIDQTFALFDENYGGITGISAESLFLSFLAGGIMSFGGHALGIAKRSVSNLLSKNAKLTARTEAKNAKIREYNVEAKKTGAKQKKEKQGFTSNPIVQVETKDGTTKVKRLSSLAAYQYTYTVDTFLQAAQEVIDLGNKYDKEFKDTDNFEAVRANSKEAQEYQTAFKEVYAAYRILASLYNSDPEAFSKANEILTAVKAAESKDTSNKFYVDSANKLITAVSEGLSTAQRNIVVKKLVEAKMGKEVASFEKGDAVADKIANINISEKAQKDIQTIIDNNGDRKTVITENGTQIVDDKVSNTTYVPIKAIENGGADAVIEMTAEEMLVNAIVEEDGFSLSIGKILSCYKNFKNRSGDANAHNAILELMYNPEFFSAVLQTADHDTYNLLTALLNIEKTVVVESKRDAKYKEKLNQIVTRWSTILYNYLIYQPTADISAVPDEILSKERKTKIKAARYCQDLNNRVLDNVQHAKMTEQDFKILDQRINAIPNERLAFTNSEAKLKKESLKYNLRKGTLLQRQVAMDTIADYYQNIFRSPYDGQTYMPNNTWGNKAFNAFLKEEGLTVNDFRNADINSSKFDANREAIIAATGEYTKNSIVIYYNQMFAIRYGNSYIFEIDDKNNLIVMASDSLIVEGYSTLKHDTTLSHKKADITKSNIITSIETRATPLHSFLDKRVSDATKATLTVDDIVNNPKFLNEESKQNIMKTYGAVTPSTAFLYLQAQMIKVTPDASIVVNDNGEVVIAKIESMSNLFKNKTSKLNIYVGMKPIMIGDIIDAKYLGDADSRLGNIIVAVSNDPKIYGGYYSGKNVIMLSRKLVQQGDAEIRFAIAHEFQHAIQYENQLNFGTNRHWLSQNNNIDKDTKLKIVKDFAKHMPYMYDGVDLDSDTAMQITEDIGYYGSGESAAYGLTGTKIVNMLPMIARTTLQDDGYHMSINTPWGATYNWKSQGAFAQVDTRDSDNKSTEVSSQDNVFSNQTSLAPDGSMAEIAEMSDTENIDSKTGYTIRQETEAEKAAAAKRKTKARTGTKNLTRDRKYVSQKRAKDSNLQYFTGKNQRFYAPEQFIGFVEESDLEKLPSELADKIKDGTLRTTDIMNYLRDADEIDDYTFNLINKHYFKNKFITTFNELKAKIDPHQAGKYYAIRTVLKVLSKYTDIDLFSKFVESSGSDSMIDQLTAYLSNMNDEIKLKDGTVSSISKLFTQIADRYENGTSAQLKDGTVITSAAPLYSEKLARRVFMQYYDGTADGAGYAASIVRWAAYANVKITGELKTESTSKTITNKRKAEENFTVEDTIADQGAEDAFADVLNDLDRKEAIKILRIAWAASEKGQKVLKKKGSHEKAYNWLMGDFEGSFGDIAENMTQDEFDRIFNKYVKDQSTDELIRNAIKSIVLEVTGKDIDKLTQEQLDNADELINDLNRGVSGTRPAHTIVDNMRAKVRSISRNLSARERALFMADNNQYFEEVSETVSKGRTKRKVVTLRLKKDVYWDAKKNTYKDTQVLEQIEQTLKDLSKKVHDKAFTSAQAMKTFDRLNRKVKALEKKNEKLIKDKARNKVITFEVSDNSIEVSTDREIPEALSNILDKNFRRTAPTDIKVLNEKEAEELSEKDRKRHVEMNLKAFLTDNAEAIAQLTQQDIDEIIDFYTHSEIIPTTNKARQYTAVRTYLLAYIVGTFEKGYNVNNPNAVVKWTLTNEQYEAAAHALYEYSASVPAAMLGAFKAVQSWLKPEKVLTAAISDYLDLEFNEEDLNGYVKALQSGDAKIIMGYRKKLYKSGLETYEKKYGGKKKGYERFKLFENKLLAFERMCMLSGPGTWIRNQASNALLFGVDWVSSKIGQAITKIFPKASKFRDGQYKIIGTKTDAKYSQFIKDNIYITDEDGKTYNLFDLIGDGLSKYHVQDKAAKKLTAEQLERRRELYNQAVRQVKKAEENLHAKQAILASNKDKDNPQALKEVQIAREYLTNAVALAEKRKKQLMAPEMRAITDVVIESLTQEVADKYSFNSAWLNKINKALSYLLSDNWWIKRKAVFYLGKIMTEDNVDISSGLESKQVLNSIGMAYKMAAADYMHKTNAFRTIERMVRKKFGNNAYFIYKQILPFAVTSWNWFVEGLKLTPIGLIKSIVDYARIDSVIAKIQAKEQAGEEVSIPSSMIQYKTLLSLGKGVFGTIGTIIGIILAATGVAGIDEEDDKYKLHVGNVYIDISDIFGSQGILLGIAVTSTIVTSVSDKENAWDAVWNTINAGFQQAFLDNTVNDVVSAFRYSDNLGDWLTSLPSTFINMITPNLLKSIMAFAPTKSVQYDSGIVGKLEKIAVTALPVLAYAFPKLVDPYTGETQVPYVGTPYIQLLNKVSPVKIYPYTFSDTEREALALGVTKSSLTGSYTIDGESVKLSSAQIYRLNLKYGELNKEDLADLMNNKTAYKVYDEDTGKYVTIKYSKMTDEQKKSAINSIMSDNASIAKIYILTSTGKYKYYATDDEYSELKKLGIRTNVYKETTKHSGYVS